MPLFLWGKLAILKQGKMKARSAKEFLDEI